MNETAPETIFQEYKHFADQFKTVILSSINKDGSPHASYAPFIRDAEGCLYIFISRLAKHTHNIVTDKRLSILFIENEEDSAQSFARKRLTFDCLIEVVERDASTWKDIMSIFIQRFGNLMETLMSLSDFTLIKIQPNSGIYVRGFGEAYAIKGDALDQIEHLRSSAD